MRTSLRLATSRQTQYLVDDDELDDDEFDDDGGDGGGDGGDGDEPADADGDAEHDRHEHSPEARTRHEKEQTRQGAEWGRTPA